MANHCLPTIVLIATGGTIAGTTQTPTQLRGYRPAALPVEELIRAIPGLDGLARVRGEQPYSTGSQHLTSQHWLTLADRVQAAQADPEVAGIVITHGTDTLEETALFLDLVCSREKPVVLTGAMRPATAASADGPLNLFNAIALAADPGARGGGTMVLLNDEAWSANRVAKLHTSRVDAFGAKDGSAVATLIDGQAQWHRDMRAEALRRPSLYQSLDPLPAALPRVDLVPAQVDGDPGLVDWLCAQGARGLVSAGTGNGTLPKPLEQALARAVSRGIVVVRASRVAFGPVIRDGGVDDSGLGFSVSGWLPAHKARLVTSLALAAGLERTQLQDLLLAL